MPALSKPPGAGRGHFYIHVCSQQSGKYDDSKKGCSKKHIKHSNIFYHSQYKVVALTTFCSGFEIRQVALVEVFGHQTDEQVKSGHLLIPGRLLAVLGGQPVSLVGAEECQVPQNATQIRVQWFF